MERVEAELFTDGGNSAVVRLPGRVYYYGLRSEEAFAMRVEDVTLPEPDADEQLKPGDFALPGRVRWHPRRIRHPSGVAQRA